MSSIRDRLQKRSAIPSSPAAQSKGSPAEMRSKQQPQDDKKAAVQENTFTPLKEKIHRKLVEELNEEMLEKADDQDELIKRIGDLMEQEAPTLGRNDRLRLISEILAEVTGFGPIDPLLKDPTVSEVMVNSSTQIYVERKGKLTLTDVKFRDDAHVMRIIEKIVAPLGRRIDESSPLVDARLPDGSRVNAIIPPLALKGPCITIRKFSKDPLQITDLIRFNSVTSDMAKFLQACVEAKLNIVVSGGTGSGKTTTLNILSSFIPSDERIVTIEDAAELQLRQEHVVTLETRPANIEGKGAISMRELVKNSLRMRPDRIVVGEVRSGEALDMLQAMNTGHDGSLTTGHANTPRDMLSRLETMVLMAGMDLPVKAIREQIASAVHLIVQQNRLKDGSRKITHITEINGMEGETIVTQDIFLFEQTGVSPEGKVVGRHKATGIVPKFYDMLQTTGINLPVEVFSDKNAN